VGRGKLYVWTQSETPVCIIRTFTSSREQRNVGMEDDVNNKLRYKFT
jgi:hypothetical protein